MSLILGMDPGASTGVAHFLDGQLVRLDTITPVEIERTIREVMPARVIFEDSRLQSHLFSVHKPGTPKLSIPKQLKIARNVGQIDGWCSLITEVCAELGIDAHGISPAGKGVKRGPENFAVYTGWAHSSNQHERDAAMVAWPYRGAR